MSHLTSSEKAPAAHEQQPAVTELTIGGSAVSPVSSQSQNEKGADGKNAAGPGAALAEVINTEADPETGLPAPTEEELTTLRRVPAGLPWAAFLVAFCELVERLSYYSCTQIFQTYIQRPRPPYEYGGKWGANTSPEGIPGALGRGQSAATGITTFNTFWVYLMPLLGAYLADAHWGRFKTICVATGLAMVGHVILIINGIPAVMDHAQGAMASFIIAILVMGLGTGWFKPNVSSLIAEQVTVRQHVRTEKNGERVIVDPQLTIGRLFMYFYLCINIGAIIGQIGASYASKYVGYLLAFAFPAAGFALCIPVLFFARNRYVKTPPSGSVLANALRVFRLASRGRWSWNPVRTVRNLRADDFWPSAMPSRFAAEDRPKWMRFDDAWVAEVRRGFKACGVFTLYPLFWLTYSQISNNLPSQAGAMTRNGLPVEIVSNFDPLFVIIMVPICDRLIYPGLRRMGINFSPLKRITAGFFVGAFAMVYAAVMQHYIYKTSPCGTDTFGTLPNGETCPPSPINVWAQSGSYCLVALSEIFTSIGGLEYAYSMAPSNMKSLVMAFFFFQQALSSAIGEAFVSLAEDPHLVVYYSIFAGLSALGGILFMVFFRHLDQEQDQLMAIQKAHYDEKSEASSASLPAYEYSKAQNDSGSFSNEKKA